MPTTYEIHPDPAFFPFTLTDVAVVSPAVSYWGWLQGMPVDKQLCPLPVFWAMLTGPFTLSYSVLTHGIPGVTTLDDEFPEDAKPQFRLNQYTPPTPPEYFVMYLGCPGVKQGDDNWDLTNPSYRPQLRLNTIPHTTDPVVQDGRWRVNEAFLPSP